LEKGGGGWGGRLSSLLPQWIGEGEERERKERSLCTISIYASFILLGGEGGRKGKKEKTSLFLVSFSGIRGGEKERGGGREEGSFVFL